MADQLTEDKVRQIVSEEITGSKDIGDIKGEIAEIKDEQTKQGVLLEDLHAKFDKNIDLLTAQMNVKRQVDKHEGRLDDLETGQRLLKTTVKLHSRRLVAE